LFFFFSFFLDKKRNKKIKAGKITASRQLRDKLFLPGSYVQLLCYCDFNISSLLLSPDSLHFSEYLLFADYKETKLTYSANGFEVWALEKIALRKL